MRSHHKINIHGSNDTLATETATFVSTRTIRSSMTDLSTTIALVSASTARAAFARCCSKDLTYQHISQGATFFWCTKCFFLGGYNVQRRWCFFWDTKKTFSGIQKLLWGCKKTFFGILFFWDTKDQSDFLGHKNFFGEIQQFSVDQNRKTSQ